MRQPTPHTRPGCGRRISALLLAALLLPHAGLCETPIRVAVVEVGAPGSVPAGLDELLTLELSRRSDVVMLDRQEVGRLLAERSLSARELETARPSGEGFVEGVDRFILLGGPTAGRPEAVPVRVVDSRYGIRLLALLAQRKDPGGSLATLAGSISAAVVPALTGFAPDLTGSRAVSVGAFRNGEVAERALDEAAQRLGQQVAAALARRPGTLLLERGHVGALSEERALAPTLPAALRESWRYVDGSFTRDRARGPKAVLLRVRSRDSKGLVRSQDLPAALDQLDQVADQLAAWVLADAPAASATQRSRGEANLFARDAQVNLAVGEGDAALSAAEAAYALAPQNLTNQLALVAALGLFLDRTFQQDTNNPGQLLVRTANLWRRRLDVAHGIAAHGGNLLAVTDQQEVNFRIEALMAEIAVLAPLPDFALAPGSAAHAIYRELQAGQRQLFDELYAAESVRRFPLFMPKAVAASAAWHGTSASGWAHRRQLLGRASAMLGNPATKTAGRDAVLDRSYAVRASWDDAATSGARVGAFLRALSQDPDPVLRLSAWHALLWQRPPLDFAPASRCASNLIAIVEREVRPADPAGATDFQRTCVNALRNAGVQTDWKIVSMPAKPPPAAATQAPAAAPTPALLDWRRVLTSRDLGTIPNGRRAEACHPRRLLRTSGGLAVVGSNRPRSSGMGDALFGVFWLEPSGAVRARAFTPAPIGGWSGRNGGWRATTWGPVAASWRDTVFIATPDDGLLVFEPGRPAYTLGLDQGIPPSGITALAVLGDALYVVANQGEGLLEWSLTGRVSRVVFSLRNQPRPGTLDGRHIQGLAVDQENRTLWIESDATIYSWQPGSDRLQRNGPLADRAANRRVSISTQAVQAGPGCVTALSDWLCLLLTGSNEVVPLPEALRGMGGPGGRQLPAPDAVLGFGSTDLLAWRPGSAETRLLYATSAAASPTPIQDVQRDGARLWLLTGDALWAANGF